MNINNIHIHHQLQQNSGFCWIHTCDVSSLLKGLGHTFLLYGKLDAMFSFQTIQFVYGSFNFSQIRVNLSIGKYNNKNVIMPGNFHAASEKHKFWNERDS